MAIMPSGADPELGVSPNMALADALSAVAKRAGASVPVGSCQACRRLALRLRDSVRARSYADSRRKLLGSRSLKGPNEGQLLVLLAGAEGIVGNRGCTRPQQARTSQ